MAGLSTKPKLNSQAANFFGKIGATQILEIDASKLSSLSVIQDGKAHASIMPSEDYLKSRGMSMEEALRDWNSKGSSHELSEELEAASGSCQSGTS